MRNKAVIIFIVLLDVFMLTGCWNYVEINQQINVSGIAIDVGRQGRKYHLSAEVVTVGEKQASGLDVNIIETEADTVFEGIRNLMTLTSKKLYFGHCKVLIIGEKAAKNGISEILDMSIRNHEFRIATDVVVSRGCEAKDILMTDGMPTSIIAYKIYDLLKTSIKAVGSSPISKAYLVFNSIQTEGVCTVIPALEIRNIEDEEALKLCGAGIFVKDKLQCCIDEFQTKSLSFINNKIKTGLLTIKISDQSNQFISYEIYKSKTKRELLFEEDVLSVNIIVETTVIIGEVETKADFTKTQEIEKIRQLLKKNMEEDLSRLIDTAQVKMKCDIFGIGPQINRNYPEMWEKYKDNWDEIFKKLKINVECRIKINGSGISNKTAMGLEK